MLGFWEELQPLIHEETINGVCMKAYKNRPKNLNETLEESVKRYPNKIALVHGKRRLTYHELYRQVNNVAYQLKYEFGVKKGDRVAFLLMNGTPFVVGVYAALKIGAIAVPLNTKLKSQELEFMLQNSDARILIANKEWWPNLNPILKNTELEKIFITDEQSPTGSIPFSTMVEEYTEKEVQVEVDETDNAFIMYTSGTTGRPKGALITHSNVIHTILNYKYCYNLKEGDSTVIAVPVFHITGLAAQLMPLIYLGGKIVLMPMFHTKEFLEILRNEKITHVIASPTVFVMTLLEPNYRNYDVTNLRVIGFGGAPMPGETLRALKDWIPDIELHNTYGLTETTSPAVIMPDKHQLSQISAVGPPTPVTDFKIVDPETRVELESEKVGELLFKGPMVIHNYWENDEATQKTITEGWLSTGDLAKVDDQGFITIMDRIKDMINRGGEKVFSVEVEDVLYSNPKVMEVAIVGVTDKKYGEVVKACIVPREGESLTEEEVKGWVRERLAKFKVPTYVEFMDLLPRNPNGKVVKTQLKYIPSNIKK
ncbi:class I adenylate-forming enzyme family protein [Oceanobacillus sp. Castelsardo]|uniref:class I adenylate-forming enzyme family protein n=1 Tax=Oceanobacillus sp. Castelsardo TaxID=1851204 RepID=UPI0009ED263E|nr:class I adenylate-forming enzyme family protein [Oceanobacillus sp. Castelsardo]